MCKNSKPYYRISSKQFNTNCSAIETVFKKHWGNNLVLGYSVKTNHHSTLIELAFQRDWFIEVVSEDEYNYISSLSIPKHKIICNGPVKGNMLYAALEKGQFLNLDNLQEVQSVCDYSHSNPHIPINNIGLRVNFDLESHCPGETTAGESPIRFGINFENGDLAQAISMLQQAGIAISGLHMHTSTKTRSLTVFHKLAETACTIAQKYQLNLQYLDIGGGFFGGQIIPGKPMMEEYANTICSELKKVFHPQKTTLILEPGASVLATCVDYVTHVVNTRNINGYRIVTLDGTLLHINPFLSKRDCRFTANPTGASGIGTQFLCGCTCMEMDHFGCLQDSKELLPGDQVIFHNAGAYTMSFNSNFIIAPPNVILDN